MQAFKKLRPDHWAWLHAKVAMMVWAVLFYLYTPVQVVDVLDTLLSALISVFVIAGLITSIIGLFMSTSIYVKRSRIGTNIELSGLWFALAGPAVYFITRLFLTTQPDGQTGNALAALSYAVVAFLIVRIVMVSTHRAKANS